jgi:hypothetical protein
MYVCTNFLNYTYSSYTGKYPDQRVPGFEVEEVTAHLWKRIMGTPGSKGDARYNYLEETSIDSNLDGSDECTNDENEGTKCIENAANVDARCAPSAVNKSNTTADSNRRHQRILCMVYTYSGRHDQVRAVLDTWGKRCDGFVASSNVTDTEINAIAFPRRGPEEFHNIWQKVR